MNGCLLQTCVPIRQALRVSVLSGFRTAEFFSGFTSILQRRNHVSRAFAASCRSEEDVPSGSKCNMDTGQGKICKVTISSAILHREILDGGSQ
ncbi:unnamed protein product [Tenebrio molitor]|nr:unnamed protein product [Tenebrio molitor]